MSLREQKKARARRDIIAAASDLIDKHGYERAKMRDIAAAAEISYQTLYNYFPTKALILQAILIENVTHIASEIGVLVERYDGNLLGTLIAINRVRLDIVAHHGRELWRIVSIDLLRRQSAASDVYQFIDQAAHSVLIALLRKAQMAGDLDGQVDTELMADTIFALSQHSISSYIMESAIPETALLDNLHAQIALLLDPYLKHTMPDSLPG